LLEALLRCLKNTGRQATLGTWRNGVNAKATKFSATDGTLIEHGSRDNLEFVRATNDEMFVFLRKFCGSARTPKALHNKAQGQPRSGATLGYESR